MVATRKMCARIERKEDALRLKPQKYKRRLSAIVGYILLIFGAISLTSSIIYVSTILAFIGLGLTFWGALLPFMGPTRHVKVTLLNSTAISSLTAINEIIDDLKYEGKGVYLPPRYLKGFKSGSIFIPSKKRIIIPPLEEIAEEKAFLKNPQGICFTPSGLSLVNLFERELGTNFAKVDLNYIQNNLPMLFIEDLEIAEDLEINIEGDMIQAKITGSIYNDLCKEARKLSKICCSFGCPLCSSIAIALTRATGKPIIIKKTEVSEDNKIIEAYYRIIEE